MSKYQEKLTPNDLFLELEAFTEGHSTHAWKCFGAHPAKDENGAEGYLFRVWVSGDHRRAEPGIIAG